MKEAAHKADALNQVANKVAKAGGSLDEGTKSEFLNCTAGASAKMLYALYKIFRTDREAAEKITSCHLVTLDVKTAFDETLSNINAEQTAVETTIAAVTAFQALWRLLKPAELRHSMASPPPVNLMLIAAAATDS